MKNFFISCFVVSILLITQINAQVSAKMFQYPDVSKSQIVFTYSDDIWIVSKAGGTAHKLTSAKGIEAFARFSRWFANCFYRKLRRKSGCLCNALNGRLAKRITYHGMTDRIVDWYPDGKSLLFASTRESGKQRFSQF